MFYSIQYKNDCLAAADIFHLFTQSIKLYTFTFHEYRCLKNVIHQIEKMNGCFFQEVLRQNLGWFLS